MTEQIPESHQKNLCQVGTPPPEEKIYISSDAYARIHADEYEEKRVFVLMGHTQRNSGKYAIFIEGAISVREIEFDQTVPLWNNRVWTQVFNEIKRSYDEKIIVGWALDLKGYHLRTTEEIEKIHREHFGGMHQLFFLLDTMEPEEQFYFSKFNHLVAKEGFYIYYKKTNQRSADNIQFQITEDFLQNNPLRKDINKKQNPLNEIPQNIRQKSIEKRPQSTRQKSIEEHPKSKQFSRNSTNNQGGRYRQFIQGKNMPQIKENKSGFSFSSVMLIFAIAAVVVAVGQNFILDKPEIKEKKQSVQTMGDVLMPTETSSTEEVPIIPVEEKHEKNSE